MIMRNVIARKKSSFTQLYLLPPILKLMLALLVFIVICTIGIIILKNQSTQAMLKNKSREAFLEKEITVQARTYGEVMYYSKNTKIARQEYEVLLKQFPPASKIGDLLSSITKLGTESGLKFISFRPQNEIMGKYYASIPVDISVVGKFHELAQFLSGIANLPASVVVVNQLTFEHSTGELLTLNFVATLYHTLPNSTEVKV